MEIPVKESRQRAEPTTTLSLRVPVTLKRKVDELYRRFGYEAGKDLRQFLLPRLEFVEKELEGREKRKGKAS